MSIGNTPSSPHGTGLLVVGAGVMARHHVRRGIALARARDDRPLGQVVVCDPSVAAVAEITADLAADGRPAPIVEPDLGRALDAYASDLDVALIATPHALHHDHTVACLQAGLDVLLEKPMVTTVAEALSVIEARDASGALLVVGFNGSLSPQIRTAVQLIQDGAIGSLTAIHGSVWQNWLTFTQGTWRLVPELAGGGFVFDTGAHLLNTTCDLAGEDFTEVSAWLDHRGQDVDLLGSIMARTASGVMVTLAACGDTGPSCTSDLRVFGTEGFLHTGVWGERLNVQARGASEPTPYPVTPSTGPYEMFLDVRAGVLPNPSPAELGLRMAHLWDLVKASAAEGGRVMRPTP